MCRWEYLKPICASVQPMVVFFESRKYRFFTTSANVYTRNKVEKVQTSAIFFAFVAHLKPGILTSIKKVYCLIRTQFGSFWYLFQLFPVFLNLTPASPIFLIFFKDRAR